MATVSDQEVPFAEAQTATQSSYPYLDWPAIFAGMVFATAVASVMLGFGAAIGLSFLNFHNGASSAFGAGIAAASWLLWVEVSSMMVGGYLTGRMRRRAHDATEHESDVRDGAHGLVVWAGALILGAIVAAVGVGALASGVGGAASTIVSATAPAAAAAANKSLLDPTSYFVDTMFRPGPNTAPVANSSTADASAEAGRILTNGALTGSISDADRGYLDQLVAKNTGLSVDDAKKRVDGVLANIDSATTKAADAAETARKVAVVAAFLTAASLLVAAAGAYWAAMQGGNHRDKQTVFHQWFRRW